MSSGGRACTHTELKIALKSVNQHRAMKGSNLEKCVSVRLKDLWQTLRDRLGTYNTPLQAVKKGYKALGGFATYTRFSTPKAVSAQAIPMSSIPEELLQLITGMPTITNY